ncbi:SRPBCC family protein [Chthonobacter rhizosphaerae]|uniref:SRPBCC family protein n=1 Tax=Chthonobacter rhizosphaerae TaxID=2735553 RepID=UPI0015EF77B0|nr:SRPBCC family protein [Chthonobacter rhizosphaerae]
MPKVARSTILSAPVDRAWAVLRDFNGHDRWQPLVAASVIERGQPADRVGAVRRLRLADGTELREQLIALSDLEQTASWCLLDTPIPLFNCVAHVRLLPVTDGDRSFWSFEMRFDTRPGEEAAMIRLVGDDIIGAGFQALQTTLSTPA